MLKRCVSDCSKGPFQLLRIQKPAAPACCSIINERVFIIPLPEDRVLHTLSCGNSGVMQPDEALVCVDIEATFREFAI